MRRMPINTPGARNGSQSKEQNRESDGWFADGGARLSSAQRSHNEKRSTFKPQRRDERRVFAPCLSSALFASLRLNSRSDGSAKPSPSSSNLEFSRLACRRMVQHHERRAENNRDLAAIAAKIKLRTITAVAEP